ncbi:Ig-like domain-containing protein [Methylobacterium sp. Leaf111]|uniref:Ig-like domain-containing protein n=1 Tax=Methylobacterium sp. Leaf111 TaxID=1736257 RepID=UPI00138F7BC7|nr:cadherin-like domain-containing protein [Methylobacterium sp. Leaf111]
MIFLQRAESGASLTFNGDAARILKGSQVVVDWTVGGLITNIPEGSGYTVEFRTGSTIRSESLAVGIVVLTLGQSNMKGWYQTPSLTASDAGNGYMYDSGQWVPVQGAGAGAFANSLSASLGGVPVAFVNGAVNGSALFAADDGGFGYWEGGPTSLYPAALQTLSSAGGKAEFVLWAQGEADVGVTAARYQSGLTTLFTSIQKDLPASDVLIVGLGPIRVSGQEGGYKAIRQGQAGTAAAMEHVEYVPTDLDLDLADGPHLSGASRAWQAREVAAMAAWLRGGASASAVENLGTADADQFHGTTSGDMIAGYGGADELFGNKGNDLIRGGDGNDFVSGDEGDDLLSGGNGDDTVLGGAGSDEIYGDAGDDVLDGGSGDDLLFGGEGINQLIGGAGNDTFIINLGDTVVEMNDGGTDTVRIADNYVLGANVENLVLLGKAVSGTGNALNNRLTGDTLANQLYGLGGDDYLFGAEASDTLSGGAGNDLLDGGTGADMMIGDTGDDTYFVDNTGDVVREFADEGIDTAKVSIANYTLPDFVENLVFGGSGALSGAGNELANTLRGGSSTDALYGRGGDDQIYGLLGNDILDGGVGDDTLYGGAGNDTYYVDAAGDRVSEIDGGGSDTIYASASFALPTDVEALILIGSAAINGTGNELANRITGNDAANVLSGNDGTDTLQGGGGDDVLDGGSGADTMNGGTGNDTYVVDNTGDIVSENGGGGVDTIVTSLSSYTLSASFENLVFTGSSAFKGNANDAANKVTGGNGNDVLNTYGGADILDGGAGADTMTGGLDNDVYYVDNVDDTVIEYGTGGIDLVRTTLNLYTLPKNVERSEFLGSGAFKGTGGTGAETLVGGTDADTLDGSSGNDTLIGLGGNDTLIGGSGTDTAAYQASVHNHQLVRSGGTLMLRDVTGVDGTDTLSSIEWLTFAEGQFSTTANNAPIAVADSFFALSGAVTALSVLANDWDLEAGRTGLQVSLVSGPAHGALQVNADGVVSYTSTRGFTGTDSFTYRLSDGALTSGAVSASITVQPPVNTPPVFTSPATVVIFENNTQVLTLAASDADAGDALVYTIAGGPDASLFRIVNENELEFVAHADFEGVHGPRYDLQVKASDGTHEVLQTLKVVVADQNDMAPVMTLPATVIVPENQTQVLALSASDADTTGETITFGIRADGADAALFRISGSQLSFVAPPDFESANHGPYSVTIVASDGINTTEQSVKVEVTDVNDSAPVFAVPDSYAVLENTTKVATLAVSDADSVGGPIRYSLKPGTGDAAWFRLLNHDLEFVEPADHEASHGPTYSVTVVASDGLNATEQAIAVTVQDVNDTAPVITTSTNLVVTENETYVADLAARDADTTGEAINFSIKPDTADADLFRVVGGRLEFVDPIDREGPHAATYSVTVVASDGVNATEQAITVVVEDANDNAPVFTSPASVTVTGGQTKVVDLTARDADVTGSPVSFSIKPDAGEASLFRIVDQRLEFVEPVDHEADHGPNYSVTVIASDGLNATEQTITVAFQKADASTDRPPLDFALPSAHVDENAAVGTVVGTLQAMDPSGENAFTLLDDAAGMFRLDGANLIVAGHPDFELASRHTITVRLTDGSSRSVEHAFAVSIGDANDNAPVFTSAASFAVAENTIVIGTLAASDADTTGEAVTFSILPESGDSTLFAMVGDRLQFVDPVDYEASHGPVYSVTLVASDGVNSTRQTVAVSIEDANDNVPVFTTPTSFSIVENTTRVASLAVTDPDSVGAPVSLGIKPGTDDADLFRLDGSTLYFVEAPDFENPDHGPYHLTVVASDGVNRTEQVIEVAVTDAVVGDTLRGTQGDDDFTLASPFSFDTVDGLGGTDRLVVGASSAWIGGQGAAFVLDLGADGVVDLTGFNIEAFSLSGSTLAFTSAVANTALARGGVTFAGTDGNDTLDGSLGGIAMILDGGGGADVLRGGAAADLINGGAGNDQMSGGLGNDTYVVDSPGDMITERAGEGSDTVRTDLSIHTLGANLENLVYTGASAFTGTGNALANAITGSGGADRLDGLAGADTMIGGLGDDSYIVDNVGDVVVEKLNEGNDGVTASVSYTLATDIEKLTLTGKLNLNGTGNALANTLSGNSGDNVLIGLVGDDAIYAGAGNDTLIGGWGADVMTGNGGADAFVFDVMESKVNKDTIKDFEHGIDHIVFSKSVFAALESGTGGALDPSSFVIGSAATNTNHHIIYNPSAAALYYDTDGLNGAPSVLIATFSNKPVLDVGDILVL